jgi:hypothetical protein
MFDDIRIRLDIPHAHFDEHGLHPDGTRTRPQRIKAWGIGNQSVRVRSVKGPALIIEGSFNGFLNGHTVVGSMDLQKLVKQVVDQVLGKLKIEPTPEQQLMIDEGRIKLERLDLVGYLRVDHLGGVPKVLEALDVGLAGSRRNRMIFPRETVVYHSHSKYWSLMLYDKAQHLRSKQPELWKSLDPRIKDVARTYVRVELRQFGKELKRQGNLQVRDVDVKEMKALFEKRLRGLLDDVRRPYPVLRPRQKKPTKALLLGLLAKSGVDLISGMEPQPQRRARKQLRDQFGIDARSDDKLPKKYRRTLRELIEEPAFPIRHGAPRAIRKAGILALI